GGVAKGQIVREIDALGGAMAQVIDATAIQFRMLNRAKGPAMHSPRAQADKKLYQFTMKHRVEAQPNLTLRQEIVEGIVLEALSPSPPAPLPSGERGEKGSPLSPLGRGAGGEGGQPHHRVVGVRARGDTLYRAPAVVLTTGTFLKALMHMGEAKTR